MILVPLLTRSSQSDSRQLCCELRVRGTRAPGQPARPRENRREKRESPDGALSASRRALNLFVSFRPFFRVLAAAHGRAGRRVYFLCAARGAIGHGAGAGIDALVDRCVGVPLRVRRRSGAERKHAGGHETDEDPFHAVLRRYFYFSLTVNARRACVVPEASSNNACIINNARFGAASAFVARLHLVSGSRHSRASSHR